MTQLQLHGREPGTIFETHLPARLDRLPWGRFHTLLVCALGITWLLDGLEVTLAGSVSGALKNSPDLHMSNVDIGLAGGIYIAGAVLGAFGCAVAMKLIANYLVTIHTLAAAEALNLGVKAGFSAQQVVEVIRQSAGGSTMFSARAPMMADRHFLPAPGPFATLEKYIDMASELSEEFGSAAPLFNAAKPYFLRAIEEGIGEEDISAVIKLIEADSKAESQAPSKKEKTTC